MANTTHLGITLVEQSQAQKEVTVNQALTRIDAILNTGAISRTTNVPPGSPASGDLYIVGASPTGAWAGQAGKLAYYDQVWKFITPNEGMTLWVNDEDTLHIYNGSGWAASSSGGSGFANIFRNATLDIWQRGTSGTITAGTSAYTADGWIVGSTGANATWQQLAGRALSAYCLKVTGNPSMTNTFIRQRTESFMCYPLAGRQVTVQAQIYNNTGASITPTITVKHAGSVDNWSSPVTDVNAQNLQPCANTAWTLVSYTFTAHASSGNGLEITIDFGGTLNTSGKSVQIGEADARIAPGVQSPEMRPVAIERMLCLRYLPAFLPGAVSASFSGQCSGTGSANIAFPFTAPARIPPTGSVVSSNAHFQITNATSGVLNPTAINFSSATTVSCNMGFSVASGLVAGNATYVAAINTAAYILFTGAEL